MRLIVPALLLVLGCFASFADDLAPQIQTVSPRVAKQGDTVVVTGISLGDDKVEEVYLSDHKFDMKVKVLEQSAKTIKFRVPPFAKGRMQLLMLMKPKKEGDDPKLLELPAYLLIEEVSTEITQMQEKGKKTTQEQK